MSAQIETSIIIRAYNEEKHLPALFAGLASQDYRDFEVIVVDSGSFDRTRDIAREHATRLVRIENRDFTFGYSLNCGIRSSTGAFIVAVSAHTIPVGSEWLRNLVAPLRNEQTAMVYGRQLGVPESKLGEVHDFERTFGPASRTLSPPHFMANNANSAIRRDLWNEHAFDESLPGLEDIEWAKHWMEKGLRVQYQADAAIYHIHEETWPQVRRRYYREAVAAKRLGLRGPVEVPGECLRESRFLFGDLLAMLNRPPAEWSPSDVFRFRYEKLAGTVHGLLDGTSMQNTTTRARILSPRTCKAVVIDGPRRASIKSIELPPLKPSEVLIKVAYEGVCGTDLEILEGTLGYYKSGQAQYPITPGHEFAGTVAEVGPKVEDLHEGDRVVAECIQSCGECAACARANWTACEARRELGVIGLNGAYAEYVVVPRRFVHRIPDTIPLSHASLCEPLAVVLKGVKRLTNAWRAGESKRCLVVGGGPIGHLCAQVLSRQGHDVAVYDRHPARRAYFDGSSIRTIDTLDEIGSFEALVDATGDHEILDQMVHQSSAGATLLLLGLPYARREFSFEALVSYDKTVVGSVGSSREDFVEAIEFLPQLDLALFTQKAFPLEHFEQAWTAFRERQYLKVQLAVGESLERAGAPLGTGNSAA